MRPDAPRRAASRLEQVTKQRIHTGRRIAGLVATAALAAASLFFTPLAASAHDELIGSDPASGATVEGLPAQLTLSYSAVISAEPGASEVSVTDAAGTELSGEPVAQETNLVVPLEGEAEGAVRVLWKVVSSDGHPISGEFSFTVTPPPAPVETATPTPTPSETESAPVETPSASPEPVAPEPASADVTPWIVVGVLVLLAALATVYLVVSRARRKASGSDSATPSDR